MAGHHVISIPRGTCREGERIMGIKNITQLNYVLIKKTKKQKKNIVSLIRKTSRMNSCVFLSFLF